MFRHGEQAASTVCTEVVANPSTQGRCALQGAPLVVDEVATPCCMHASRLSISYRER